MAKLRQKSDFNISAAEHLINIHLYAPSVHCSYYSCFQLLKYTIKQFFGMDYETIAVNISSSHQKTHQFVINYVYNELVKFDGIKNSRDFKRSIMELRQFREESDYENIEIDLDKGKSALYKAVEIRQYIIKSFNV